MPDGLSLPDQIRACLEGLKPLEIQIEDQSAAHAGHAGARAGAHFRLRMVSASFQGLSRLQRHQLVYQRLGTLMQGRIHALTMSLYAPGEDSTRSAA
ncbi:BolA family transcriptional regulator [Burkholderiales bacterium]|jgi:BolA protein|nr:BolA family transcriptional regulator [Burkholderiales bacterium]